MNLVTLLEARAAECPDRPALVEGCGPRRRCLTFAELAARVRSGGAVLSARRIQKGDRILFLHPVSVDLYVALLSAMWIGAVPMLVDPGAGLAGIHSAVRRTRPRAWTGHGKGCLAKWLLPSLWTLRRLRTHGKEDATDTATPAKEGEDDPLPLDNGAPALITFTSGSTGAPKAAVRSHGFLLAQNRVLGRSIALEAGEVDFVTLPVFALANLAHGVTSVLAEGDLDNREIQLAREKVNRCAASPAFFDQWLNAGLRLTGMKKIFTGGGPVFPPLLERLGQAAPDAEIAAVYGSTEAEPIAHLALRDVDETDREAMKSGEGLLAGHPEKEIRVAILPDRWGTPITPMSPADFANSSLVLGEAGEIVVSGEHVLTGYLGGVGDGETKFRVGDTVWHRTGDAGRLDSQGRLWLLGRCGAVIRDERGEVFPFAVETAISFHSGVRRSVVVAVEGRRVLVVEADETLALSDLPLPDGIDEVRRVARLPVDRRHRAKIDYPALDRLLARRSR